MKFIYQYLIIIKSMRWGLILTFLILSLIPAVSGQGSVAVVVSDNSADLTVARVWSQKLGATVVVTPWGSLSDDAISDVVFSQATIVYVVGGQVAVPDAETMLAGYDKTVFRVGGADRQETSMRVSERFGATRGIVLYGYDTPSMEVAETQGIAEGIPLIFMEPTDLGIGSNLKSAGIDRVTLLSSPVLGDNVRTTLEADGITVEQPPSDERSQAQKMIALAEERINETMSLIKSIRDGESLAAARLVVESKISLSKAEEAFKGSTFEEAFNKAVEAEESANYAIVIYDGRTPGHLFDLVSHAGADISRVGVRETKEDLKSTGAPYGVGIPVPPLVELEVYMVDIPGYKKTDVGESTFYNMGAKYSKLDEKGDIIQGQFVKVEIYERTTEADATKWMEQTEFRAGTESKDWVLKTFEGFPANFKFIRYTGTDKNNQEVFLKVAIGNLGVFTKFTEGVDRYTPLTSQEEAQAMVEEVTREIIKEIEATV
jgi:putative cell wall-binding protein